MNWVDESLDLEALDEKCKGLEEALKEYQHFNRINDDLDMYLYMLGRWGLGEEDKKPTRERLGIE